METLVEYRLRPMDPCPPVPYRGDDGFLCTVNPKAASRQYRERSFVGPTVCEYSSLDVGRPRRIIPS